MTPANSYHTFPNTSNTSKNKRFGRSRVSRAHWWVIPHLAVPALPTAPQRRTLRTSTCRQFFLQAAVWMFFQAFGNNIHRLGSVRGYTHKQLCLVRKLQVILCPCQGWWPTRWGLWPHLIQLERVFFWRYGILQTHRCAHIFCFKASLLHIQIKTSINTKINKYTYTIHIYIRHTLMNR